MDVPGILALSGHTEVDSAGKYRLDDHDWDAYSVR